MHLAHLPAAMKKLSARNSPLILSPTYLISITGIVCGWPLSVARENSYLSLLLAARETSYSYEEREQTAVSEG